MDSTGDASVIYVPCTERQLGGGSNSGSAPKFSFGQPLQSLRWGCGRAHGYQTKYGWQELYATALLETDWSKMEEKIQVAENGIKARLHEFSMNHGGTPEENQAIEDALNGLTVLRKDVVTRQRSKQAG
jgi:hypothetical protein